MTFKDYINHYFAMPDFLWFLLYSTLVLGIVYLAMKWMTGDIHSNSKSHDRMEFELEKYEELLFSSTSILFFTGLYFLISFRYFHFSNSFYIFWDQYDDFLLLGFLVISILMVDLMDHFVIPIRNLSPDHKNALRLAALIYMLIVFAYIKFIYEDNNYDSIITYFLIMIVGRFVYFDATFTDFVKVMKNLGKALNTLTFILATTGLLAAYGFGTQYLLKKNGVVVSLWIAHVLIILELIIIKLVKVIRAKIKQKRYK
ncbi:MAG: hypothetical protein K5773_05015 [Pseudobutyrivibrio sp.]|nr:hypothetical protein [Pseudobutyrivibrio sp.]